MSDLDRQEVDHEARRHAGDIRHATRYSEAVNRYLGAVGYQEAGRAARKPEPRVDVVKPRGGTVVVGVDETPTSYTAVDHAAIEAELRGWDLRLLHVQHAGGIRGRSSWALTNRRCRSEQSTSRSPRDTSAVATWSCCTRPARPALATSVWRRTAVFRSTTAT